VEEPQRERTQHDIIEETRSRHSGPGFFHVLHAVCNEAFAGRIADLPGPWEFPMEELTLGQLIDFFGRVPLKWHNTIDRPRSPCRHP
jgi:hypothetical protein